MHSKGVVLIADDDKEHIKELSKIFEKENFDMRIAIDAEHALNLINQLHPNIVITDSDAIDYNLDALANSLIHASWNNQCKLIVFCSQYDEDKEVKAFDLGAYDFLVKPLKKNAFNKRVEKIYLQKSLYNNFSKELKSGDIVLNPSESFVLYRNKRIHMQQRTFNLLYLLISNEGTVFSREDLMRNVWSDNEDVNIRSVDVHILKIRKQVAPHIIKTIKGIGYRFSH